MYKMLFLNYFLNMEIQKYLFTDEEMGEGSEWPTVTQLVGRWALFLSSLGT